MNLPELNELGDLSTFGIYSLRTGNNSTAVRYEMPLRTETGTSIVASRNRRLPQSIASHWVTGLLACPGNSEFLEYSAYSQTLLLEYMVMSEVLLCLVWGNRGSTGH